VKDDGASENYVDRKFINELQLQGASLCAKKRRWTIVETANINAEDGIENQERVKLKLRLGASYVYEVDFIIDHLKGFDIVLRKRWMRDINWHYQIDHHCNEMSIADNIWEEREDGQVYFLPGLCPLDIDDGTVEQAKFMGIHIIQKAALKNISTCLLERAFWIKVHHHGDGDKRPTDEPPGEFEDMLTDFHSPFSRPTYANSLNGREADFEIEMDPNAKIPCHSPYRISWHEEEELRRQIDKAICCGCIQPSRRNVSLQVVFVPEPDGTLPMCIDYGIVNDINFKHCYSLPPIEDLLNTMHSTGWFTKLDLAAGYHQIRIATADKQKMAFTTNLGWYEWWVLPFDLANPRREFMHTMNSILEPMKHKFTVIYCDDIIIHSCTLAELIIPVREVLTLLPEDGLKAKLLKCAWPC